MNLGLMFFFFFQAEDGIRDIGVTGVQTCALPILLRSNHVSADIEREMEFHMAERMDDLMAGGMSEDDARREARRRFGNPGVQKERTRDADLLTWLESIAGDVRYAVRALRGSPGFALVAVLSL